MALRYISSGANFLSTGTTFTHGLGEIPQEWKWNFYGAPAAISSYRVGTPTSTSMVVATSGAASSGDFFCAVNHTIVR